LIALVAGFNKLFALPRDITLHFQPGTEGPEYEDGEIVMNYPFVAEHIEMFSGKGEQGKDGAPEKLSPEEAGMPAEREDFCKEEYEQKSKSWATVLDPYTKTEASASGP
jgi:hypothetical protein